MASSDRFHKVLVFARLCPTIVAQRSPALRDACSLEGDASNDSDACCEAVGEDTVSLAARTGGTKSFTFSRVFDATASQRSVYDAIGGSIVSDVLDGWNGCILAYGQTGSGKTYTMMGASASPEDAASLREGQDDNGILPRALGQLFSAHDAAAGSTQLEVAFLQLYCEQIQDLLAQVGASSGDNLVIREDPRQGVYVEGLTWLRVHCLADAMAAVTTGLTQRAVSSTRMNATSSRSHAVFMTRVTRRSGSSATASTLFLVDLAGSERANKSGATGAGMAELKAINLSLSALGNVIAALAANARATGGSPRFIPYRDSKLTRLLQECVGGNARTSCIITLNPHVACAGETASTLEFGSRAARVSVQPRRNARVDYRALYLSLRAQMGAGGSADAGEAMDDEEEDGEEVQALKARITELEARVAELTEALAAAQMKLSAAEADAARFHALQVMTASPSEPASWREEVSSLHATHARELRELRVACDTRVREAGARARAAEDATEAARDELLQTLSMYRTARERVREAERDTVASLADAVAEVEASRLREEALMSTNEELTQALTRATDTIARMQAQLEERAAAPAAAGADAIEAVHAMYASAMEALYARVESLEKAKRGPVAGDDLQAQLNLRALEALATVPPGVLSPATGDARRSASAAAGSMPSLSAPSSMYLGSTAVRPVRGGLAPAASSTRSASSATAIAGLHLPSLALGSGSTPLVAAGKVKTPHGSGTPTPVAVSSRAPSAPPLTSGRATVAGMYAAPGTVTVAHKPPR